MTTTATALNNPSDHPYAGLQDTDTNYASWFNPKDVDITEEFMSDSDWRKTHKRTFFEYLDAQHRGYKNGDRRGNKRFQTFQSNRHLSSAFANTLDLTIREKIRAEKWFRRIDFQKLGHGIRLSGFALCLYLVERDERDKRRGDPNTMADWAPEFRETFDSLSEEDQRRFPKVYGQVSYQIRNWSFDVDSPASEEMDKFGMYDSEFRGGGV